MKSTENISIQIHFVIALCYQHNCRYETKLNNKCDENKWKISREKDDIEFFGNEDSNK